jgi:mono/diheme cytochrome c family protein
MPAFLFFACVAAVTCLASCAGKQLPAERVTSRGEALFNGRVKADVDCYRCHDGTGTGTWRGPNLGKRVPGLTDQQIGNAILEGPSLMPSFRGKVTDDDIRQIVGWLRERFPAPRP